MRRHISYLKKLDNGLTVDGPNQLASSYTTTFIVHASTELNRGPVYFRKRLGVKSCVGIINSSLATLASEQGVWWSLLIHEWRTLRK